MRNIFRIVGVLLSIFLILSCKKEEDSSSEIIFNPNLDYDTVTDIDGNMYKTITIGTQTWMAENLRTTKYRNGDLIGTTTPATLNISGEITPKYQWAYDGNESIAATYGRLYTWYALVDSRNLCPTGWHVPNDEEWTTLTEYLGGENVAGGKLKEISSAHWHRPNQGATNESGFTALPGGGRNQYGLFRYIGESGDWWSSTEHYLDTICANEVNLYYDSGSLISAFYSVKKNTNSVRCIKN